MALTGEGDTLADAVLATLQRYSIAATPDNYALWYDYHAGHNPLLKRTIEVIISNNSGFDEITLQDLRETFLSSVKEEQAVRETALNLQNTLRQVIRFADRARRDADELASALTGLASSDLGECIDHLKRLIDEMVRDSGHLVSSSHHVGAHIRESADKIEALETHLARALRDATIDGLTGLANRKAFDTAIRRLAAESMNSGNALALLMIDIDHFKQVNDSWGHCAGDVVLCHLAMLLQQAVRGGDHVARYGGEEFTVLLPRTDAASAVTVGENIREALARAPGPEVSPAMMSLTVSIGVSCYEPGERLSEWLQRADGALYRAKREGRNRVEFA